MTRSTPRIFAFLILFAGCAQLRAADHFLTIGGGNSPANNQVSLEKNVLFFQKILGDMHVDSAAQEVLFADGNDPGRDIEYEDPKYEPPRANVLLAELFDRESGLYSQYRSNQVANPWGPATRTNVDRWFSEVGPKLKEGDRLIIYFTGHGQRGEPARNTMFALWNDRGMSVRELTDRLDKLPPKVPVVMIMVQCYCGGFADVIFKGADQKSGPSDRHRCGFFATTYDRMAAGCTADTIEENYHEYSTYFLAALYGKTRTGEAVTGCDYDGDGVVSFAEAHAYAMLNSDTIDISNKTSDAFLRVYAKADDRTPYTRLLELAGKPERAVLEGLSQQLGLSGDDRVKLAGEMAGKIQKQRSGLEMQRRKLDRPLRDGRQQIIWALKLRWPEFGNLLSPKAQEAMAKEGDAIVKLIEKHPAYERFEKTMNEADDLENQNRDLERKWVKCQRFVATAQSVTMAANLEKTKPEMVKKYRELVAEESGTIGKRQLTDGNP